MPTSEDSSVVAAVDGSELSYRALEWAATEAVRRSAGLRIVHSIPDDLPIGAVDESELRRAAAGLLEAAAEHVRTRSDTTPPIETALLSGRSAGRALIGESFRTSLLVLGTRGRGGFARLLLGSTAVTVTAHAACPTVVIPPRHEPLPKGGPIVVGVDITETPAEPLRFAFDRAADRGCDLVALHSWTVPTTHGAYTMAPLLVDTNWLTEQAQTRLAETLAPWRNHYPTVKVTQRVVEGQPLSTLTESSGEAETLVVGSRGYGAMAGVAMGSVSQGVLRHASCPVVIAH